MLRIRNGESGGGRRMRLFASDDLPLSQRTPLVQMRIVELVTVFGLFRFLETSLLYNDKEVEEEETKENETEQQFNAPAERVWVSVQLRPMTSRAILTSTKVTPRVESKK